MKKNKIVILMVIAFVLSVSIALFFFVYMYDIASMRFELKAKFEQSEDSYNCISELIFEDMEKRGISNCNYYLIKKDNAIFISRGNQNNEIVEISEQDSESLKEVYSSFYELSGSKCPSEIYVNENEMCICGDVDLGQIILFREGKIRKKNKDTIRIKLTDGWYVDRYYTWGIG